MKLFELFDREDQEKDKRLSSDVDYVSDLKFYIDNDDKLLTKYFFPAVKKHRDHMDHPEAYKIYMPAVKTIVPQYCKEFQLDDIQEEIFNDETLEAVCKRFADEQKKYLERGDYEA